MGAVEVGVSAPESSFTYIAASELSITRFALIRVIKAIKAPFRQSTKLVSFKDLVITFVMPKNGNIVVAIFVYIGSFNTKLLCKLNAAMRAGVRTV